MFQRWWHKLFGHKWLEIAIQIPADRESGRALVITQLIRRCGCGATCSAQVIGDIISADANIRGAVNKPAGEDELAALRRMAGLNG